MGYNTVFGEANEAYIPKQMYEVIVLNVIHAASDREVFLKVSSLTRMIEVVDDNGTDMSQQRHNRHPGITE